MKHIFFSILLILSCQTAKAAIVTWELVDFSFDDGGKAHGSFVYDTNLKEFRKIDVYTTKGSRVSGRHYIATAGAWGGNSMYNILAFTDTSSTSNYEKAGWLRIDFQKFSNITDEKVRLEQMLPTGGESYCTNSECSSAANEITDPYNSRKIVSGHIYSSSSKEL